MSCIFNYYIFCPGPLWISASSLNGPPWLNKVYLDVYLQCHFSFQLIQEEKVQWLKMDILRQRLMLWYVKLRTDIQFDTGRKVGCGRPQAGQRYCKYSHTFKNQCFYCRQDESATASKLISLCALECRISCFYAERNG